MKATVSRPRKCKDYHKPRQCPVENCSAVVVRMSSHLLSHKLARDSPLYKEMISKARQQARYSSAVVGASQTDNVGDSLANDTECTETSDDIDVNPTSLHPVGQNQDCEFVVNAAITSNQSREDNSKSLPEHQLRKFQDWMFSPDGGLKNDKSVKQHVLQLRAILDNENEEQLTANRSGVLANMTMEEFNKARVVDGHYVVSFSDHKTAASYGPAKIILPILLHSWMVIYAK